MDSGVLMAELYWFWRYELEWLETDDRPVDAPLPGEAITLGDVNKAGALVPCATGIFHGLP